MKKTIKAKLRINKETVRQLAGSELVGVAGAGTSRYPENCVDTHFQVCETSVECGPPNPASATCITSPQRTCGPIVIA